MATIRRAAELGVTLFDTSDAYGTGHSEEVLGRALAARWDDIVIATKWGNIIDPATRQLTGTDPSPAYLRRAVERSLQRLGTDHLNLYQLHLNDLPVPVAAWGENGPPARCERRRGQAPPMTSRTSIAQRQASGQRAAISTARSSVAVSTTR